jgi:hypothetical protein
MKKWLAIFLAFLFAFAMIFPAAADSSTPTPTTNPSFASPMVVTITIPAMVWYTTSDTLSGDLKCTTLEGGYYDLTSVGATTTFTTQAFTCLGQVTMAIDDYYGGVHWSGGTIDAAISDTDNFYYDSDFQTNGSIPLTETGQTTGIGEAKSILLGGGSYNHAVPGSVTAVTNYFYVHASTMPPCGQDYETVSTLFQGDIPATNEAGFLETLTVGDYYELTVSGGPWNDGTINRYDTAVKVNDEAWDPLSDYATNWLGAQCTQGDPLDPTKTIVIFKAWDTDPSHLTMAWKIRVNGVDGNFSGYTGAMNFKLDLVQEKSTPGCQDQYLQGSEIQGGAIDATLSSGVYNHIPPADNPNVWVAGNWIEIVTSGGPWEDGGVPPDRYDIAVKNPDGSWSELSGSSNSACNTTSGNYVTAYYQLPTSDGIYLRVNDTGGVWNNNTGSMNYIIYSSTYSPNPATGCAEKFQVGGLITTVTANANSQNGISVGDLSNTGTDVTANGGASDPRYYAIETSGIWYDGSAPETWGGIASSQNASTTPTSSAWSNLQTAPGVVCAVPLDPIGHIRVYLPLQLAVNYWVRVQEVGHEPNWADNSGSLTFSIYKASNLQVPGYTPGTMPGAGGCDADYAKGAPGATSILYGSNSNGDALPTLTSGWVYAIETTAGPWSNNGTSSYEVAISTNNGASWTNMVAFDSSLCAESSDGNHLLMYFQAEAGRSYKLRVYDPGGNFADNTGSIDFILYGHVTTTISPWTTCGDNYNLSQITVADSTIPTTGISLLTGLHGPPVTIGNIQAGKTYALEISGASWWYVTASPSTHYYASQVSIDNGSHWNDFTPILSWATCAIQTNQATDPNQATYQIYFTAGTGTYQMRISAEAVDAAVSGHLNYILYTTTVATTQNQPGAPTTYIPPGWQLDCNESYSRPNGFFELATVQLPSISFGSLGTVSFPSFTVPIPNLDQWISYLILSVRNYFAWCPEDTAALSAIPTTIEGYEPFGTINDTVAIFRTLNNNVTALESSGGQGQNFAPYSIAFGGGGSQDSGGWQGILPVLGENSPWLGGKLAWGSGSDGTSGGEASPITALPTVPSAPGMSTTSQDYDAYCQTVMSPHLGSQASTGLCGALALAKTAPLIWVLIQLLSDVSSILIFIQYVQRKWIDAGASG